MTRSPTLRRRLIRELRSRTAPTSTSELALLCGAGFNRPSAVTLTVLLALERARVVRRYAPVACGRGRPAWRWMLASVGVDERECGRVEAVELEVEVEVMELARACA